MRRSVSDPCSGRVGRRRDKLFRVAWNRGGVVADETADEASARRWANLNAALDLIEATMGDR